MNEYKESFEKQGFFIVKNALSKDEVELYKKTLEELSGITSKDFIDQHPIKTLFKKTPPKLRFAQSDGVTKNKPMWPLLWNEKVVGVLNTLFTKPVHLLHHNDVHVGFSASGWHRDSVDRLYGKGPEWDEAGDPYELVRVGYYLQSYDECKFSLGILPGTNKYESNWTIIERFLPSRLGKFGRMLVALRYLLIGQNLITHKAFWFKPEPGDAIVFDPRLLHTGTFPRGPKYSMFVGYGVPSTFFDRYSDYYENQRKDLEYKLYDDALLAELKKRDLN